MSGDLSSEALRAVNLADKLLKLAGNNSNEHEAAAATAKAMELLAQHNLDMSVIEQAGGAKEARGQEFKSGGLYKYQRDLWRAIAELNFCLYENQYVFDANKKGGKGGHIFRHRLIGRKVNVVSTYHMAEYLEGAIERLTRAAVGGDPSQFFTRWAKSYREGVSSTLCEKLWARRAEWKREQAAKEAAARQANPNAGNAMTVADMAQAEYDANMDILYGAGWSAKERAARAARQAAYDEARILREKWEAENPEAVAAEKAERERLAEKYRKEEERRAKRRKGTTHRSSKSNINESAYWSGRKAGETISLDRQAQHDAKKAIR